MYKTDLQLKKDVEAELAWDPRLNAARLGVSVEGGAVALHGIVRTYPEKLAAEEATRRVAGVRAIAEQIEIELAEAHAETDAELARAASIALRWDSWVPRGVIATVERGHIRLTGEVAWSFERTHAVAAIERLRGVTGITNDIVLTAGPGEGSRSRSV